MYRTSEKTSLSRKMAELEDRWRKSQEDRYILELKFKEVFKGLANKNEGNKLLKIKEKYAHFMENEESRTQRNDTILRTLDKIESQANMLSAKTERLKLLKLHYEAYMKRMYPTWENEVNSGDILVSKDPGLHSGGRKHNHRNAVYSTLRDEVNQRNNNSDTPYSQRPCEKLHATPNALQRDLFNGQKVEAHSNKPIVNANLWQSMEEKNCLPRLNRDYSSAGNDSEENTTGSHGPSFEREENTSKDLLNVSLSDDNVLNETTVPVDSEKERRGQRHAAYYSDERPNVPKVGISPHRYMANDNDVGGVLCNQSGGDIGNDNVDSPNSDVQVDFRNDSECNLVRGSGSELQPSVVVTLSSPDKEKSCPEDSLSDGRMKEEEDKKSVSCDNMPSEAEASEHEGVSLEGGDYFINNGKEMADAEKSPRPSTSRANKQSIIEEPFQFSSSDADYDELENQMAALVEGKRNDRITSKAINQSVYKNEFSSESTGPELSEQALNSVDDEPAVSSVIVGKEMNEQEDVRGMDYNTGLEGVNYEDKNNFSVEETVTADEKVEEFEGNESYIPGHGEDIDGNDYIRHEVVEENISLSTVQESEKYSQNIPKSDTVEVQGIEPVDGDNYHGNPENVIESESIESYNRGINFVNPGPESMESPGNNHGSVAETNKCIESGENDFSNGRNVDFQAEQVVEENIYSKGNTESVHGNYVADENEEGYNIGIQEDESHELEPGEEMWVENKMEDVENMAHKEYDQHREVQEKIGIEASDEYSPDQYEVEQAHSEEVVDELGENLNESEGRVQESYESVEGAGVEDEQMHVKEERDESNEVHYDQNEETRDNGRDVESTNQEGFGNNLIEEENVTTSNVNYARGEEEQGIDEYIHGEASKTVIEMDDGRLMDESQDREIDLVAGVQEKDQYDTDSGAVEEVYMHKEEERKNTVDGNYAHGTIDEVEEPDSKLEEHENIEKVDTVQNAGETVTAEELGEVKQAESIHCEDQKELHEEIERVIEGEIQKTIPEEVKVVSQKPTKKEEGQAGKPVKGSQKEKDHARRDNGHAVPEKVEKPVKEIPQVPSRPLSRQSTRKEGSSPDTYKGEKLKTAIRKFQAKKDTRQTTRRSVDSKK